jgi:hypothetical protein
MLQDQTSIASAKPPATRTFCVDKLHMSEQWSNLISGGFDHCSETAVFPFDLMRKRLQVQGQMETQPFANCMCWCVRCNAGYPQGRRIPWNLQGPHGARLRLEQLVVDLYKSSSEFMAVFNHQINKLQKRAQFMQVNGEPRLGLFGTVPNESMFDRWCFSHSQGANCGSHRSHTRLPAVQGS